MPGGVTEEEATLSRHPTSALGNNLFYLGAQADTVYVLHRQDPLLIILPTLNKEISEQGEAVLPGSITNNEWQHPSTCVQQCILLSECQFWPFYILVFRPEKP